MKHSSQMYMLPCVAASLALAPMAISDSDEVPTGSLSANQTVVFENVLPIVSWSLDYPEDLTTKTKTLTEVDMKVKIYGVALEGSRGPIDVHTHLKVDDTTHHLFSGHQREYTPGETVLELNDVPAGTTFSVLAEGSNWGSRHSLTSDHVIALQDGDELPYYAPAFEQGDIESFLSSYVKTENGKKVIDIGDTDVIYLAELYSTRKSSGYYDMQDVVVLIEFTKSEQEVPDND